MAIENKIILKNKLLIMSICVVILTSATNCHKDKDCHRELFINNTSNQAIYFYYGKNFPDTSIIDYNPTVAVDVYKVEASSKKSHGYRGCLESLFDNNSKKSIFFIFDANTLETTPWDTVLSNYLILKRYEITLEDFQNNNFTLTYP